MEQLPIISALRRLNRPASPEELYSILGGDEEALLSEIDALLERNEVLLTR